MDKATQPINQMTDDELWAWWLSLDDKWRWLFLRKGLKLDSWQLVNQNDQTAYLCEQFNKQYHYQQHFDWFNQELTFQYVKQIQELTELNLSYSYISDISVLSNFTQLNWLYLRYNNISDISPLANLIELWRIDLSYNKISNISALMNLTQLERISIEYNSIHQSDIDCLQGQLPNCQIET